MLNKKISTTKKILLVSIVLAFLTGCSSSLNSSFDCKVKPGVNCKSLGQVNDAVNKGELGRGGIAVAAKKGLVVGCKNCSKSKEQGSLVEMLTPYPNGVIKAGEPLRYGERVLRAWITPYEDTQGNYHHGSVISAVAKKGHWIANPPKVVLEE